MFEVKRTFGEHQVLSLDTVKHQFNEYFCKLYEIQDLHTLYKDSKEFQATNLHDVETSLHQIFYKDIKENSTFKTLYCNLIRDIHKYLFPTESCLIYQSFPSIRFQFINNIAVPPHCDSDELGKHPDGEKNFLLPLTKMTGSTRLFIESAQGRADYAGVDLDYGELLYFNGNKCIHYNQTNVESYIRISLDFRVMTPTDYIKYIRSGLITTTNPRDPEKKRIPAKMIIGGYYQVVWNTESLEQMMNWHFQKTLLLQSQPSFDEQEAQACYDYLKDGTNFITEFKQTELLEKMLADFIDVKHVIMTTSGNMALILALMAFDFKPTDEIIVPNYTMIASVNSIQMVGAKPVIVDVDPESFTLNLDIIKAARTKQTRAVMHVSLNNRHTDLVAIRDYCKENGLILIEDAAQSLGCKIGGQHFGTFGDVGCFSLSTPKIISTGQGGFCVTNNDALASKLRMIKNFGRRSGGVDIFETFGINMKFTDIQAVIGCVQMQKLPRRIVRLREIYERYYEHLGPALMKPARDKDYIPWFVDIFCASQEIRDGLAEFLKHHNIQTRPTYPEINKTPMYSTTPTSTPISDSVSACGLFLPTHMALTNCEIDHICRLTNYYLQYLAK